MVFYLFDLNAKSLLEISNELYDYICFFVV